MEVPLPLLTVFGNRPGPDAVHHPVQHLGWGMQGLDAELFHALGDRSMC